MSGAGDLTTTGRGAAPWHHRDGPVLLLCLALAFLAYGASVLDGFLNDDALFLNQAVRILDEPSRLLTERPLNYFRPTWSAWVTLQWAIFGLEPMGYHVAGILLHGTTGFLVWKLARRAFRGRAGRGAGERDAAGRDAVPALFAAAAFICLFAHSEGVLWFAAHNSVLACTLSVAAVLAHLHAVDRGGVGRALLTVLLVFLALLAKEPAAVLLAWLPLAELAVHGWRSPFTRASWGRWAMLALAVAGFVLMNARVGDAFATDDALQGTETRAALQFLTVERVLGAIPWMFSPAIHAPDSARALAGVATLLLLLLPVALRRRDLLPAALLGAALLVTAMVPSSMTRVQVFNSSRLYYFPTVGAALLLGTLLAALAAGGGRAWHAVLALAALTWLGLHVAADWSLDARDYRLISRAQTRLMSQLPARLQEAGDKPLFLMEPWVDGSMHMGEFAFLYAGVERRRVGRVAVPRAQAQQWIDIQRRAGSLVLDCDDEGNLLPATTPPKNRTAAQGFPRTSAAGELLPQVRVIRILPR